MTSQNDQPGIHLAAALESLDAGLSPLPPEDDGSKRPMADCKVNGKKTWEPYQNTPATREHVCQWYANGRTGNGLVTGYGGLECLEFDSFATYEALLAVVDDANLTELVECVRNGYEELTPGGGVHWLYFCDELRGNTKLAERPVPGEKHKREVLIETRGEGGFVITAPSCGKTHPSGGSYRLIRGGLSRIATISHTEREALWDLARTFDEVPAPVVISPVQAKPHQPLFDRRPGDIYEVEMAWSDILEPLGWSVLFVRGEVTYWTRPDKDRGVSATTGYCKGLYVFSTSTSFEPRKSYNKFAAYTHLQHGGDFGAAAKELAIRYEKQITKTPRRDKEKEQELSAPLDDWLFWVGDPNDAIVLAKCTDSGLDVDWWGRPEVEKAIRGKKIILVFCSIGEERKAEFDALGLARSAGAIVRIWRPPFLGDSETPTLRACAERYDLAKSLAYSKPWLDKPPDASDRRPGWPLTDLGNAERMASRYGPALKHCRPWRKWLVWNGQLWQHDDLGQTDAMAKMTVRKIYEEAAAETDQEQREKIGKWAIKSEANARIEAMLKRVWCEPRIPILPRDLDPDPWLLNCRNGTINLRTGDLQPHDRSNMITRIAPVNYDYEAKSLVWESFLEDIFPDEPLRRFIQRICGIALTGDVSEQILPIFWGAGANGKSTLLGAMLGMLGSDYAMMAPPGLLFLKPGSQHPTALADLFRMRFVVDMESAEETQFNEALVKQLTGSDSIKARRMREDFWSFDPTHTLVLGTNHRPIIQETKNAIWRRVKLVPFIVEIPEELQIKDLSEQLKSEYAAILAWAVKGCLEWQKDGLMTPQIVEQATMEYRKDQDTLANFFAEECSIIDSLSCKASTLYEFYRRYAERSGEKVPSQRVFGGWLTERGFKKYANNGTWYRGIGLRAPADISDNERY